MRTILTGATVVDGLGKAFPGTVVLDGATIAEVRPGRWESAGNGDGSGHVLHLDRLVVAPGLIDMHSHDDVASTDPRRYPAKIAQGVTTSLIGADGLAYAPVDPEHREALVRYWKTVNGPPQDLLSADWSGLAARLHGRLGINVGLAVPHGNLRIRHLGWGLSRLSGDALACAVADVVRGLDEGGAYGVTTGLGYVPAVAADFDELLAFCRPLVARDRIYASHLRDYGTAIRGAIDEALDLGRTLGIRVHLSHLHLSHPKMFGRAPEVVEELERARQAGIRLTWDLYPYTAASSILHSYLPAWLLDGGPEPALLRLRDPAVVEGLERDPAMAGFDWGRAVIAHTRSGSYIGRSVAEGAQAAGMTPARWMVRLLAEEELEVGAVIHQTLADDDACLAEASGAVVGSDGLGYGQLPHPRYYGAFAAFYDRHVRQRKTLSMVEALAKMSTRSAEIVGLADRGRLVKGAAADVWVFDPDRYRARATYEHPRQLAEGVVHVWINGVPVLTDGRIRPDVRPGRVLNVSR